MKEDLQVFPNGDDTEIGIGGINLSGGQKQRICLAWALYNEADIYLLDDIFASVDPHVGSHIFEKVVTGLLGKKTRILATHTLKFLQQADLICVLNDGTISECGTYTELLNNRGAFSEYLVQYLANDDNEEDGLHNLKQSLKIR